MAEISPLRRRMTEDMMVRNLSPATQRSYLSARYRSSAAIFGRSPDHLGLERTLWRTKAAGSGRYLQIRTGPSGGEHPEPEILRAKAPGDAVADLPQTVDV